MEIKTDSANPLLDVLVIRDGPTLNTKVHRKPTHTCRYLSFQSNRPPHVKRVVLQSVPQSYRATVICQGQQVRSDEILTVKHDLQLRAYPGGFINSVINKPKRYVLLMKEVQLLGFISIPYIRGRAGIAQ